MQKSEQKKHLTRPAFCGTPSPTGEGKRKKIFDCARFAQKTIARNAKILQTPPFGRQTGVF